MKKMISKILFFFIIGILLPLYTLGMDKPLIEDWEESTDNYQLSVPFMSVTKFDAGFSFTMTNESATHLPMSYRALQAAKEHLLYHFGNMGDEPASRAQKESKENKKYAGSVLITQTLTPFSRQLLTDLKNHVGCEVEEWLLRREESCKAYKDATTELQKRESFRRKEKSHRNEMRLRNAEQDHRAALKHLIRVHGARDVVLGKREATEEEVKSIKQKINSKEKLPIIVTFRGYLTSSSAGTPYFKRDPDVVKVQGFVLNPHELKGSFERLTLLVETLNRENNILREIALFYYENFIPKVGGWRPWQLINWVDLNKTIETARTELIELIGQKYPLPPQPGQYGRDCTTDYGSVLAYLNGDERGLRLRAHLACINRSFPKLDDGGGVLSEEDIFFSKLYCGEDELEPESVAEGCHIGTTYPHPNPLTVNFVKVKRHNYVLDEERYKIRILFEDPTTEDFKLLKPNELALYLKGGKLYCKAENEDEIEINVFTEKELIDFWFLKQIGFQDTLPWGVLQQYVGLQKDIYRSLQMVVQDNLDLAPGDRRALLSFLLLKKYIARKTVPLKMPQDIKMVEEYPSPKHALAHKKFWSGVVRELQATRFPITEDGFCVEPHKVISGYNMITSYSDLYESSYIPSFTIPTYTRKEVEEYNALCARYEILLRDNATLLREMHQPFGRFTYIPTPIEFFISEHYVQKPPTSPVPFRKIVLTDIALKDGDLQRKRMTPQGYEFMLYYYFDVDLSHNSLTGNGNYHFYQLITRLNLSGNNITSLQFLSFLPAIKVLNLSENRVSDLSDIQRFAESADQGGHCLQELDLSKNRITNVAPLSALRRLRILDVSGNRLETLKGLCQPVVSSSGDKMQEDPTPEISSRKPHKLKNKISLTSLKVNNNALRGNFNKAFPGGLDHLETLEIANNPDLQIPEQPYYFFKIFPNLKALKTDNGEEVRMSKEPVRIDLSKRSLGDENVAIIGKVLEITGKSSDNTQEVHPLFYYIWLDLSCNDLIGNALEANNFSSHYITKLNLEENSLCSLTFIAGFPNLTYLNVSHNLIGDASPIGECLGLEHLNISYNELLDLKFIQGLSFLEVLIASSNRFDGLVGDIFPKRLERLTTLSIGGNPQLQVFNFNGLRDRFSSLTRLITEDGNLGLSEYRVDENGNFIVMELGKF